MHRSFSFRHLTSTSIAFSFWLLVSCLLLLNSCSFNPNYQRKGSDFLQGEWKQDSVERQKLLVSYELHNFRFTCDSFYVSIASNSKVNYGADTCMNSGHWMEYAKGTYEQQSDTLHLKGFFCNPDFSLKKEGGCFRFGAYVEDFKISSKSDSALALLSFSSTIPVKLRLVKRVPCVEKPL
ncbi:fumarate hydratase [Mucilaginibacter gracilis]|nr:fumarate hydratase [Mucilaginibacter gracilis]